MTKSEVLRAASKPCFVIRSVELPSSLVIPVASFLQQSSQPAEQQLGIGLRGVQIVDQLFHRLERRQRRHYLAQLLHALAFIGMLVYILTSRRGENGLIRRS